jgi:hypothetical protein
MPDRAGAGLHGVELHDENLSGLLKLG